ncbi:4Fe-4S dicluster domain-containing protein [Candidatus Soleaferrea massiliensis]|uniref:4Fe-4S dicluster domain-containing protein n=1 Tax=Candidatus Soleaferrea massiliensis TaxID=1470354 RepID=UPI00058F9AD0|nr:4Fe-4S dicluster domain-containing protein [Candidatus Soleaferrea massiliensis]
MRLFDTNVQQLKYSVLKEVVRLAREDKLEDSYYEIPRTIIPGPKATMRCCIYRERAIVEERVKIARGGDRSNENVVEVIDSACDECPVNRYSVTDTCRGCIAHRCESVCPAGAISFDKNQKAKIDPEKCLECGRCMKVCPYNAITESQRPCVRGCKAKAIVIDENKKAKIDEKKCVSCGACVYQCPFGAIVDKSCVVDIVNLLKESENGKKFKVYAAIAPAIVSQFTYAKIGQIVSGIKKLGFHSVIEVALGADIVASMEAKELAEKEFLTSSCCPAFVKYIEINFPKMVDKISHNVSPMVAIAQLIKKTDKNAKVVFIGPCIAKKAEVKLDKAKDYVDYVLTFEELQAMFDGYDVDVENLPEDVLNNASYYGRIFARSGGVAEAVEHVIGRDGLDFHLKAERCDGLDECKVALLKASRGKLDANFIEGMACEGGCIGGAACLQHGPKNRSDVDKYGKLALEANIDESLRILNCFTDNKGEK